MKSIVLTAAIVLAVLSATESPADDFYKGKPIRIVVGFSAGGGFDTYARAIARHMSKHIPGNPGLLVENMTGAGSLIAANHVYKVAKPDGLTIGHFIGGLFLGQVLGQKGIEFDDAKKSNLSVDPISVDEVERGISGLFKLDPTLVGKFKDILYN